MAIRQSMTDLVARLRSVTGAATDDVYQGVTYWSDKQLQDELDAVQFALWAAPLTAHPRKVNGSTVTLQWTFTLPRAFWVEASFTVRDRDGMEIDANEYTVTVSDRHGTVTFDTDPDETDLTLDLTVYDWHAAAASVWGQKAAHRHDFINLKAADHKFDMEADYLHCVQREQWHSARKVKGHRQIRLGSNGFVPAISQQAYRRNRG